MPRTNKITVILTVIISLIILKVQGADKYSDENRPYEFGFTIDGEQHRHEKKDENGLIMGEYGFITADGVYHVTVYATDENGNFRILSMKNLRVKPYPTAPEKKGHSLPFPPSEHAPITQGPVVQAAAAPIKTCSSCSIPVPTTEPPKPQLSDFAVVAQDNPIYNKYPQYPREPQTDQEYPNKNVQETNADYPHEAEQPNYPPPEVSIYPDLLPPLEDTLQPGERNPKQFNIQEPQPIVPEKPQLIYAQMQIVDRQSTDIHQIKPGEREGLPQGLTKQDMKQLLYTFNYTVGFHGHHEEGFTDGSKVGYYFVTNRNGERTKIDYVADEKGFRPKITKEVLDLLSEDVPKEETEKDDKYGLKGYEFKWLYFPINDNTNK